MDEEKLAKTEGLIAPVRDEVIALMGTNYQEHPQFPDLMHAVTVLCRPVRHALDDLEYLRRLNPPYVSG